MSVVGRETREQAAFAESSCLEGASLGQGHRAKVESEARVPQNLLLLGPKLDAVHFHHAIGRLRDQTDAELQPPGGNSEGTLLQPTDEVNATHMFVHVLSANPADDKEGSRAASGMAPDDDREGSGG